MKKKTSTIRKTAKAKIGEANGNVPVSRRKNYPLRKWYSFQRFVIVDADMKPMAWSERSKQLCYCSSQEWRDTPHPLASYLRKTAEDYIQKTITNRKRWNMEEGRYLLMPFAG